jgi:hypothetical protein
VVDLIKETLAEAVIRTRKLGGNANGTDSEFRNEFPQTELECFLQDIPLHSSRNRHIMFAQAYAEVHTCTWIVA